MLQCPGSKIEFLFKGKMINFDRRPQEGPLHFHGAGRYLCSLSQACWVALDDKMEDKRR